MTTVIVNHQVADVEAWQHVFDEHGAVRRSHGCSAERSSSTPATPTT